MEQQELEATSLRAALEREVYDAGGWAAVAQKLYPEKFKNSPDAAERHLRNSIDPNHTQKFDVYQHQVLKDMAKSAKGRCASIEYDCAQHDYTTPTPIEPEDDKARLQREFIDCFKGMKGVLDQAKAKGFF